MRWVGRVMRVAAFGLLVVCAAAVVALLMFVVLRNERDRDRLYRALQERNRTAADADARAARRIDVLSSHVDALGAEVQALREQVIALGGVPVTVVVPMTPTTSRTRPGAARTPPPTTRPGPSTPPSAPPTTRRPATTTTTTRPLVPCRPPLPAPVCPP